VIARVLVAAFIVRAAVGAECRPPVGHPLARNQFGGQTVEECTNSLVVCMREYMTGDDVRWLCDIAFEQRTPTGDAALFVRVPAPLGGLRRLKGGYISKSWNVFACTLPGSCSAQGMESRKSDGLNGHRVPIDWCAFCQGRKRRRNNANLLLGIDRSRDA
jgi:hypothetical protein